MVVRVELADAVVDFPIVDRAEGRRIIRAITGFAWFRRWAVFDYEGGKKRGCLLRREVLRAGMLTEDEARAEAQVEA